MISIVRQGPRTWRLTASHTIPLPREKTVPFFQDPRNLAAITPPWLAFRLDGDDRQLEVYEGAEFDYTIRWLGIPIRWRSRISLYRPPERFADVQIIGPYARWEHFHTFTEVPEGTLMTDEVRYVLPMAALPFRELIKRQLQEIFRYRAERVDEWARDELARLQP